MAKIMVVDDSKFQRGRLVAALKELSHHVLEYNNGQEALEAFPQTEAEIIVTDLLMPVMDGQTLIKNIRQSDKKIPIIVLTANIQNTEAEKSIANGANAVLNKPLNLPQLSEALDRLLGGRHE